MDRIILEENRTKKLNTKAKNLQLMYKTTQKGRTETFLIIFLGTKQG